MTLKNPVFWRKFDFSPVFFCMKMSAALLKRADCSLAHFKKSRLLIRSFQKEKEQISLSLISKRADCSFALFKKSGKRGLLIHSFEMSKMAKERKNPKPPVHRVLVHREDRFTKQKSFVYAPKTSFF